MAVSDMFSTVIGCERIGAGIPEPRGRRCAAQPAERTSAPILRALSAAVPSAGRHCSSPMAEGVAGSRVRLGGVLAVPRP